MKDEEIKNKAKETSGGNYYYEQGFIYGFELGEENSRKETTEKISELEKEKCELLGIIQGKDEVIAEFKAQIEKMKCCSNCKNVRYEWGEKVIEGVCCECKKYDKWEFAE